jgi:hypothetical protein
VRAAAHNSPPFPRKEWEAALRDSALPPRLKDLARRVASYAGYADEDGRFWVSREDLRREHVRDAGGALGQSKLWDEKTIDRRVARVVEAGWFHVAQPGGIIDGRPVSTVYQMAFPPGLEPAPSGDSTSWDPGADVARSAAGTVASHKDEYLKTSRRKHSGTATRAMRLLVRVLKPGASA